MSGRSARSSHSPHREPLGLGARCGRDDPASHEPDRARQRSASRPVPTTRPCGSQARRDHHSRQLRCRGAAVDSNERALRNAAKRHRPKPFPPLWPRLGRFTMFRLKKGDSASKSASATGLEPATTKSTVPSKPSSSPHGCGRRAHRCIIRRLDTSPTCVATQDAP
jgi:hypothetical protein